MTGLEYGPEWLLSILVILGVLLALFFRREARIYGEAVDDYRDRGVRRVLDEVGAEAWKEHDDVDEEDAPLYPPPYDQEEER